ncbi:EutN/CcmL family microcompartment protein [uncultured Anaerococcus sp.]|uniref:EutN/CcmL family microcompartment protein n=1 Tax=uncultured Anaerococcus sp. TaxID=293428 RepID=UPI00288B3E89|nr:EutN/CcmL family microcompartment protein [uncultured Anaerococcus sp.]
MIVAKLIGNVWATRKYEALEGMKFMLVEVLDNNKEKKQLVAVDTIGAGIGDRVLISQGSSARRILEQSDEQRIPIDAVIVAIIDDDCKI